MNKKVKVFAPASVSNVGCGYDIMGFAIEEAGDILEIELTTENNIVISDLSGSMLPLDRKNVVWPALSAMKKKSASPFGINVSFIKKIKPGSGIGSSAASSVAAVYAYNKLLDDPFDNTELVEFAMLGEKLVSGEAHADNVAPSLLGGFKIIRSYNPLDIVDVPFPGELICTVIHPDITIKTADSRRLVKKTVSIKDAVTQTGNAASLVTGLITSNMDLIRKSVKDVFAEPYRSGLIPGYDRIKNVVSEKEALGFNISGSGPSVFAFSLNKLVASDIASAIQSIFSEYGIESDRYISCISNHGARLI